MPVEHRDYPDIAPAGPTYSRGTKAGNLLFISGLHRPRLRVPRNVADGAA